MQPERWIEHRASFQLFPWEGRRVVLLTKSDELDPVVIARFVQRLDGAFDTYRKLVGAEPERRIHVRNKSTVAAVPQRGLTCGLGCGHLGSTGIEVEGFYDSDYPQVAADADAFPHYYFYELGRNFYVFGDKHSTFTTGFAVFMRYVCMDALECKDPDQETRRTIESAEAIYADSDLSFLDVFTDTGKSKEKGHRLKDTDGKAIVPSDQPVMYASVMLRLRADLGGDPWVERFFEALRSCDPVRGNSTGAAMRQCLGWLVSASQAAGKDLAPRFVERWHMPLNSDQRKLMSQTAWGREGFDVGRMVKKLEDCVPRVRSDPSRTPK